MNRENLKEEFRKYVSESSEYELFVDTELEELCISFIEKKLGPIGYLQIDKDNPAYLEFLDSLNKLMETKINNSPSKKRF